MQLEFILLAALTNYLRKHLGETRQLPHWRNWLIAAFVASLVMIFADAANHEIGSITVWIGIGGVLAVLYLMLTRKELAATKPTVFAVLPLVVVELLQNLTRLISPRFADEYNDYFETASLFAVVWLIAMAINNRKQRKRLAIEQQKAEQKEQELKITEALKAQLEIQVAERTTELTSQKALLEQTIIDLKETQSQLIQSEKMASLGELTAGIAHEIQNPLNFVNNFAELNLELIDEIKSELSAGNPEEAIAIADDLRSNNEKIAHHGKRADSIVKGMLQHSRKSSGVKESTDINGLIDECMRLSYHGLRAKDKSFNANFKLDLDESIGKVNILSQDIGRVFLNLFNNAFYAVTEKKQETQSPYEPLVTVTTKKLAGTVLITITDNGKGIPAAVREKIFQPFFTTKPTGKGTGLGLSISYDIIVNGHCGKINLDSKEGEFTSFIIELPA